MSGFLAFLAHTENMQVTVHCVQVCSSKLVTARLYRSGRLRIGASISQEYGLIPRLVDIDHCILPCLGKAGFLLLPTIHTLVCVLFVDFA